MSGIKISELNKWSISDIEGVDAKDILIPVSINATTGCLRANTIVNILRNTPSDIDARQNERIAELNEQLSYITSTFENYMNEMNRKYNELVAIQSGIDISQTSQINQNTTDIDSIVNVNNQQSAQIDSLTQWEQFNNQETNTGN